MRKFTAASIKKRQEKRGLLVAVSIDARISRPQIPYEIFGRTFQRGIGIGELGGSRQRGFDP